MKPASSFCHKVDRTDDGSIAECDAQLFHQDLGSRHTDAHINSHMADDGYKAEQDGAIAQQAKSLGKLRSHALCNRFRGFLLNTGTEEQQRGKNAHKQIDGIKNAPAQT